MRRRLVKVFTIIGIAILIVAPGPAFICWEWLYVFPMEKKELVARHAEARDVVDFVYEHYFENGEWPPRQEVEKAFPEFFANGWSYEPDVNFAVISNHGPFHMGLHYHFWRPEEGEDPNRWTLSVEGIKEYFKVMPPYSFAIP